MSLRAVLSNSNALHLAAVVLELNLVQHVGVAEQTLLEGNNQELAVLEKTLDHEADVLGVRQVQGGVDLVQDVQRGRLVLEQGKNERQCE